METNQKLSKTRELQLLCEYTLARHLHKNSICPLNHHIGYGNGWFYIDDKCFHDADLRQEAIDLYDRGYHARYRQQGMSDIITLYDIEGYPQR